MAKGFKAGVGGGASLNFKVVGNPRPESAKENTIWVNTDVPIGAWYFSATQPENLNEGDVWFPTGTSSSVEFNALKKNGIQVYPLSAKQYVGDAFVDVTAKIYQGSEWVDFILYLFKSGVGEIVPLTKYVETNATIEVGTDSIICRNTSSSYYMTALHTEDKKDISQNKVFYVDARLVANRNQNSVAHITRSYVWDTAYSLELSSANIAPDIYTLFTPDGVRRVYQLDISSINSEMYVGVLGNPTELEIFDMWLE